MFSNLRYINALGGILADYILPLNGVVSEYLDPNSAKHANALTGAYGPIAAYVARGPAGPTDPLTVKLPRREFRRALLRNGMPTASVLAVIETIPDPTEREDMQIWWEDTVLLERHHPILIAMVDAAGLTPQQGDAIWIYGVGLLNGS